MLKRPRSSQVPDVRTELPGPSARRLIEQDQRCTSPSYTRVYPLVVKRGQGAMIEDVDGNRFLDFTAGIAICFISSALFFKNRPTGPFTRHSESNPDASGIHVTIAAGDVMGGPTTTSPMLNEVTGKLLTGHAAHVQCP